MLRHRPNNDPGAARQTFQERAQPSGSNSREFEFPGEDAVMRKEGERLIIEPAPPRSLLSLLATLKPLEEDFQPIPDHAPDPVDL
jgi:antitoxin VapB